MAEINGKKLDEKLIDEIMSCFWNTSGELGVSPSGKIGSASKRTHESRREGITFRGYPGYETYKNVYLDTNVLRFKECLERI